ncbi:MAG TPA: protease SohB, partial [Shewanella frigidimarina]|nr:protease SohB [Shewanella frigidimarina]
THQVIKIQYQMKKKLADKIAHGVSLSVTTIMNRFAERNQSV